MIFKVFSKPDSLKMGSHNISILSAQNLDAVDVVRNVEAIDNRIYIPSVFSALLGFQAVKTSLKLHHASKLKFPN